jgi:hypothetical protein
MKDKIEKAIEAGLPEAEAKNWEALWDSVLKEKTETASANNQVRQGQKIDINEEIERMRGCGIYLPQEAASHEAYLRFIGLLTGGFAGVLVMPFLDQTYVNDYPLASGEWAEKLVNIKLAEMRRS